MVQVFVVVENTNFVTGVVLNLLLLLAIRRFTRKSLGSYKYLLTIFAAFDVFLSIVHASVKPRVIIIDAIFGVASEGFEDRTFMSIYCACFTVPFALMNIHFLYRFWSIRHPHLIPLFSKKWFIALLATFPVAEFVTWHLLCFYGSSGEGEDAGKMILRLESVRRFGKVIEEGWIVMNYWENDIFCPRPFFTMLSVDGIMVVLFTIASTFGGMTYYHIKRADKISVQMHSLQLKLLIAVCAQTFVPLLFVYIPYFCAINFPFFRLKNFFFDDASMQLTSAFPAWDAVIMILLMKDYRDGLIGMVRKKKPLAPETVWKTTQAMMMQSTISNLD